MSKNGIKCPYCGGQNLTIWVEQIRNESYIIENNKLYKHSVGDERDTGNKKIFCRDCLQNENVLDPTWKITEQESQIIKDMLDLDRSADVTEYMK
jgi:hypothetical protein